MPNFLAATRRMLPVILANVAAALPVVMMFVFYAAPRFEERYLQDRRDSTRVAVETVTAILATQQARVDRTELTLGTAQEEARTLIKTLRYGKGDYFWIQDTQGKMIMHPIKPELEGQDLAGIKDPNGKAFFYELMQMCNRDGQGSVDYLWPKPGMDKPVAKTSFAKLYAPWGWVVGNGVYLDDVQADIATFSSRLDALLALCIALSLLIAVASGVRYARSTMIRVQVVANRLMGEAGRLGATASEINTASQQLAESTTEQSAAIEETVTSMEEIGSMIAQTAQSAKDTMQQVDHGQKEAATGQDVVVNMVTAMRDISVANDKLKSLVRLIDEIKNKTKVINDIAFETRLLSFNAAIEAARAGAGGRGFAVVAEEVGKLAVTSSRAADEVRNLLDSSAAEVGAIVDETRVKVATGQATSGACEHAFTAMSKALEKIAQSVQMIATATREQEAGVKQTNTAMGEMERVTQGNSRNAEHLSGQAKDLIAAAGEVKQTAETMLAQVGGDGSVRSSSSPSHSPSFTSNPPAASGPSSGRGVSETAPRTAAQPETTAMPTRTTQGSQGHGPRSPHPSAPAGELAASQAGETATAEGVERSDSRWRSVA